MDFNEADRKISLSIKELQADNAADDEAETVDIDQVIAEEGTEAPAEEAGEAPAEE